jgi:hypothetical protein
MRENAIERQTHIIEDGNPAPKECSFGVGREMPERSMGRYCCSK